MEPDSTQSLTSNVCPDFSVVRALPIFLIYCIYHRLQSCYSGFDSTFDHTSTDMSSNIVPDPLSAPDLPSASPGTAPPVDTATTSAPPLTVVRTRTAELTEIVREMEEKEREYQAIRARYEAEMSELKSHQSQHGESTQSQQQRPLPMPMIQPFRSSLRSPGATPYVHLTDTSTATDAHAHVHAPGPPRDPLRAMRLADVPEYSGEVGSAASTWIGTMERYWQLHPATDTRQRALFASNRLRGAASQWYEHTKLSHPDVVSDWDRLVAALRSRFNTINAADVNRTHLYEMRQGRRPVSQYISEFLSLSGPISPLEFTDIEQRKQFVHNLDPSIREYLLSHVKPTTLFDAMAAAQQRESAAALAGTGYSAGPSSYSPTPFRTPVNSNRHGGGRWNNSTHSAIPFSLTNTETDSETAEPRRNIGSTDHVQDMMQRMMRVQEGLQVGLAAMAAQGRGQQQRQHQQGGAAGRRGNTTGQWQWPPRIEGVSPEQVQERAERGACFRCGQMGHQSRQCPSVRRAPAPPRSN